MALDILTWIFAGGFAACAIIVVYLILGIIWPVYTSPGKYFMRAKKGRKPIIITDTGKYFRFVVGDEKIGQEKNQVIRCGTDMIKIPNVGGLKYSEGNVLMGVAEDFRAMVTNVAVIDLMEAINRKGWDMDKVNELLTELTTNLKIDLGYVDGGEKIREKYEEDIAVINSHYDAAVERIKAPVNPEDHGAGPESGDNQDLELDTQGMDIEYEEEDDSEPNNRKPGKGTKARAG